MYVCCYTDIAAVEYQPSSILCITVYVCVFLKVNSALVDLQSAVDDVTAFHLAPKVRVTATCIYCTCTHTLYGRISRIYMYMVHAQCKYIRDDPNTYFIVLSINM